MPTISQAEDIIYLLTQIADWAAGCQMLLHYKALIISLSFPFRKIQVRGTSQECCEELARSLEDKILGKNMGLDCWCL